MTKTRKGYDNIISIFFQKAYMGALKYESDAQVPAGERK